MKKNTKVIVTKNNMVKLPEYQTKGSVGCDVYACVNLPVWIQPGESKLISTGLKVIIPEGYEIQVRPRSGLALKKQITVLNTPGTVDSDYRQEIGVILINHGKEPFHVNKGDRIGQLVMNKIEKIEWDLITEDQFKQIIEKEETERKGGFGSTGK